MSTTLVGIIYNTNPWRCLTCGVMLSSSVTKCLACKVNEDNIALRIYAGGRCRICGEILKAIDLRKCVPVEGGVAHRNCCQLKYWRSMFDKNNEEELSEELKEIEQALYEELLAHQQGFQPRILPNG